MVLDLGNLDVGSVSVDLACQYYSDKYTQTQSCVISEKANAPTRALT